MFVYCFQNDFFIYDDIVFFMVFVFSVFFKNLKFKGLSDFVLEFGFDVVLICDNEGEVVNYGVYYDDIEYDYMQYFCDFGIGVGEVVFVEVFFL